VFLICIFQRTNVNEWRSIA